MGFDRGWMALRMDRLCVHGTGVGTAADRAVTTGSWPGSAGDTGGLLGVAFRHVRGS